MVGGHYHYEVQAINAHGTSYPAPYVRVRLSGRDGSGDPDPDQSRLTATSRGNPNEVYLAWHVPTAAGTYDSFQIWRRTPNGDDNDWTILVADTGSLSAPYTYTDLNVDAGEEYEYDVFAANGARHWTSPAASVELPWD